MASLRGVNVDVKADAVVLDSEVDDGAMPREILRLADD